jgi:signal transduction histidine kinase
MGVVLVFRDVSDRKAMEAEREARTRAELQATAARAARDAAEAANQAKDQFLAVLSHELRSPLNAIVGWLAMLRRGLDGAQRTRALDTIERNVHVQAQLINDLLDVSRIVSGKLSLEQGPIDMAAVIQTAVDNARPIAAARGIALESRVDALGGAVHGDAQRLLQVVNNLLTNALKFTSGGGRVDVTCVRATAACIDVVDTGVGIAPEFLPHVFDRFRQWDESDARAHGGLGLGPVDRETPRGAARRHRRGPQRRRRPWSRVPDLPADRGGSCSAGPRVAVATAHRGRRSPRCAHPRRGRRRRHA